VIVASLFEKRASGLYHNTAGIIDADGSLMGVYRKMHIPDDPLYYEKFYFTPGDTGFQDVADPKFAKIGVLICWDQWFPKAPA
jgi:N-carbamoylputrescine amidase